MPHIHICPEDDLQAALDTAPENAVFHLAAGIYRRKAVIRTPGLTLIGEGPDRTVIVWDDYARKPHPTG